MTWTRLHYFFQKQEVQDKPHMKTSSSAISNLMLLTNHMYTFWLGNVKMFIFSQNVSTFQTKKRNVLNFGFCGGKDLEFSSRFEMKIVIPSGGHLGFYWVLFGSI